MNPGKLLILMSVYGLSVGAYANANAANAQQYDQKTLAQVAALYGLSEDAAITRLANEYDAAVQARYIEDRNLPGYAGAWFDQGTQSLHAATTQTADFTAIKRAGAAPVLVAHSLIELETARIGITKALESSVGAGTVRQSYVDVQTNAIVFGIRREAISQASAFVQKDYASVPIRLMSVVQNDSGFSTDLHGADPTRNGVWPLLPDGTRSPCSVGASAEKIVGSTFTAGYATAGHCGQLGNPIVANDGTTS